MASSRGEDRGKLLQSSESESAAAASGSGAHGQAASGSCICTFHTVEDYLKQQAGYFDQLVHVQHYPGRPARFGALARRLHPQVHSVLSSKGIERLYSHQVRAINACRAGKHVVISTSTSSGKSLVFNVPVFEQLLEEPQAVALYMFPTKALAQDQLRALQEFIGDNAALKAAVRPATFDGDTLHEDRGRVRSRANVILCNPDILHCAILPHHHTWSRVLRNLRFVVLDECHVYRGAFGAHVAMVLRRLLRLTVRYGSWPQFVACSATIANPGQLFRQLVPHPNALWHTKRHEGEARQLQGGSGAASGTTESPQAQMQKKLQQVRAVPLADGAVPFRQIGQERQVDMVGETDSSGSAGAVPATSGIEPTSSGASTGSGGGHGAPRDTGGDSRAAGCSGSSSSSVEIQSGLSPWDLGVEVVTQDGSAAGRRKFVVWNPPLVEDIIERRRDQARQDALDANEMFGPASLGSGGTSGGGWGTRGHESGSGGRGKKRGRASKRARRQTDGGSESDDEAAESGRSKRGGRRKGFSIGKSRAAIAFSRKAAVVRNAERMLAESESGATPVGSAIDFVMDLMKDGGKADNASTGQRPSLSSAASESTPLGLQGQLQPPEPKDPAESNGTESITAASAKSAATGSVDALLEAATTAEVVKTPRRKKPRIAGGGSGMYHGSKEDRLRPTAKIPGRSMTGPEQSRAIARLVHGQQDLDGPTMHVPDSWIEKWKARKDADYPARKSSIVEGARLLADLVKGGMKTLLFVRVRKVAELLLQYTHEMLGTEHAHLIPLVKSYRGGYMKQARRRIERELFSGRLLGVVATNALELGVDIGALDAVVLLGYPGSAASMWQQAGRAGRGGRDAVAILVTWDAPVDQFFVRNPGKMFARPPEAAHVDVCNPSVIRSHAICAAKEAPLTPFDLRLFGTSLGPVMAKLRRQQVLVSVASDSSSEQPADAAESGLPWVAGLGGGIGLGQLPLQAAMAAPSQLLQEFDPAQAEPVPEARQEEIKKLAISASDQWQASMAHATASAATGGGGGGFLPSASLAAIAASSSSSKASRSSSSQASVTGPSEPGATPPGCKVVAFKTAAWVKRPHQQTSIRSIDDVSYEVVDVGNGGAVIDTVERFRAHFEIYQGAIYMNQGAVYKVHKLDMKQHKAEVRVSSAQYYTQVRDVTDTFVVSRSRSCLGKRTHFGRFEIHTSIYGYRKVWRHSGAIFEMCDLSMPPVRYITHALWTDIPLETKVQMDAAGLDFIAGCHSASHAVITVLPLFVLCDKRDLGCECPSPFQRREKPLRFSVYDKQAGGIGIAAAAFPQAEAIYRAALQLCETCECEDGCPSCIHDLSCSEFNYVSSRLGAIVVLRAALKVAEEAGGGAASGAGVLTDGAAAATGGGGARHGAVIRPTLPPRVSDYSGSHTLAMVQRLQRPRKDDG